jgi:hypothetical protein
VRQPVSVSRRSHLTHLTLNWGDDRADVISFISWLRRFIDRPEWDNHGVFYSYICAGGKDVAMLECAGTNMVVPVEILPKPPLTRAAAWEQKSLTRELEAGGNDYLNKELSGGNIVLDMPAGAICVPVKIQAPAQKLRSV